MSGFSDPGQQAHLAGSQLNSPVELFTSEERGTVRNSPQHILESMTGPPALTFNCTDWVLQLLKSIGVDIKTTKGKDSNGNEGNDPGDFGEDLRRSGGTQDNSPSNPSSGSSSSSGFGFGRSQNDPIREDMQRQCQLGNRAACN